MIAYSPEDIVNMALRRIGYDTPIGFMYEGSRASRVAVEIYSQTRDDLLRSKDWPFARQAFTLVLLKTAPVGGYSPTTPWSTSYPPLPWIYEYEYPPVALEVRSVRPKPIFIPEYSPKFNRFVVASDPSLVAAPPDGESRVVLTNLSNAQAVITAQITDTTQWEANFIEGLADVLAVKLQNALSPEANMDKERIGEAQQSVQTATMRRG